jgi:hypothetical protein
MEFRLKESNGMAMTLPTYLSQQFPSVKYDSNHGKRHRRGEFFM